MENKSKTEILFHIEIMVTPSLLRKTRFFPMCIQSNEKLNKEHIQFQRMHQLQPYLILRRTRMPLRLCKHDNADNKVCHPNWASGRVRVNLKAPEGYIRLS